MNSWPLYLQLDSMLLKRNRFRAWDLHDGVKVQITINLIRLKTIRCLYSVNYMDFKVSLRGESREIEWEPVSPDDFATTNRGKAAALWYTGVLSINLNSRFLSLEDGDRRRDTMPEESMR